MGARRAFAASAALYGAVVAATAPLLPARVALHFGADGTPDRLGGRTELLVTEVAVGLGMVALFAATAALMRRAPLGLINVPHPEYWKTDAHEPELRRRLEADAWAIGTATMLLLTAVAGATAAAAVDGSDRLPAALPVVVGAYVLAVLGLCVRAAVTRYRPPAGAAAAPRG